MNNIPNNGQSITAFIPKDYTIIDSVGADFNDDKLRDIALLVQGEITQYDNGKPYYTKDDILIILFLQTDKTYKLSLKKSSNVSDSDVPADIKDVGKRNNMLKLVYELGTYPYSSTNSYFFRYQNKDWFLIGYLNEVDKGKKIIGEDYNLLNGSVEKYSMVKNKKTILSKYKIKIQPLKKLMNVNPWNFEIKND